MSDMMSDTSKKNRFINANRRGFLQGAAVAGGVAATGAATTSTAQSTAQGIQEDQQPEVKAQKGYELTDHIRKYYKRARF